MPDRRGAASIPAPHQSVSVFTASAAAACGADGYQAGVVLPAYHKLQIQPALPQDNEPPAYLCFRGRGGGVFPVAQGTLASTSRGYRCLC
jgi:hypothetical protein